MNKRDMKIQKILLLAILAGMASTASAQFQKSILKEFQQNSKFGGYVIGKYDYNDKEGTQGNGGFDLRLGRVYVDGKVQNFNYKLQVEVSGTPNTANTTEKIARIVDAYAEWEKYPFAKIKFGQFKRAFTFENPYNPFDVGFNNYSQVVSKLSGMADRNGEHSSGGRDLGIQLQGDFAKMADGHNLIHYQVMVANGQGINHSDVNKTKDVIGTIQFVPIKNLYIGAFGWTGNYTKNGVTVDRNRMSFGFKYESDWTFRGEYATSQGHKISDYSFDDNEGVYKLTKNIGKDKADGWYLTVGAPVAKGLKIYGKWDVYRDYKSTESATNQYTLSANYYLNKNLKIQGTFYHTHTGKEVAGDHDFNTVDVQLYWRF